MDRKSLPLLIMLVVAALLPTSAGAAASAVNPPKSGVTELPGVENESSSSTAPVLSPDLVQRNGVVQSFAAPVDAAPAKPAFEFKSQDEARDKIRRAYLLQKNDELLKLSQAALAQWPDDASFDYYREIAESRIKAGNVPTEKEPAYKKLRDKRRKDAIRAILNESTGTAPVAGSTASQASAGKPAKTPGAVQAQQAAGQVKPRPQLEPVEPAPVRQSAVDQFKAQLGQPVVMYCLGGIVALALIVVVLLRRKGSPAAKTESKDKVTARDKSKAKAEPKKEEPASTFSAAEELDSLFKPAAAEPAKPTPESDRLDELFGSVAETPTRATAPVPEPAPEPEPDFAYEETAPVLSGPIRLDDTPIELPGVDEVPPISEPVSISELTMPEPVTVAAEPEIVAPISLNVPEDDPFYKRAEEPQPVSFDASTIDLLSIEPEADRPITVSDPNAFFQPIMPEILEPPSIQPESANTNGFGDDVTATLPPTEEDKTIVLSADEDETMISLPNAESDETVSAEADLPAIDTTPAVSVHDDETVALDDDTRDLSQETAVSPEVPVSVEAPADGKGGAGEDLFSREYQKGMSDFSGSNWAGAVHHLSIAAALKPGSGEVKERLREARRRRKESGDK